MQERRLARVEAELSGEQSVLAWLQQVRPIGFAKYGMLSIRYELRPQVELQNEQSALLYQLIVECNTHVGALLQDGNVGRLITAYLRRVWHTTEQPVDEVEAECLRQVLTDFVVRGESVDGAVRELGAVHLGGRQVLFCDSEKLLDERKTRAQTLVAIYGIVSEKTALPPISQAELRSAIADETRNTFENIQGLVQAQVQLKFGSTLAAMRIMESIPALRSFFPRE
jgi:hypothetical protein